jgi:hypothetical protein
MFIRPAVVMGLLVLPAVLIAQAPARVIEDGALDRIELFVTALDTPTMAVVAMTSFDTSATDLGTGSKDGKQTRQEEAKTMQAEGPRVLAERFTTALKASGPFKDVVTVAAGAVPPEGALVLTGRFVTLDPGSRAKRYFAGFGAGKSSVKVTGEVKDATGNTLATFEQRRIGAMGMGGGDSLGKLMSDSRSIGEDLAKFMARWARGESLKE